MKRHISILAILATFCSMLWSQEQLFVFGDLPLTIENGDKIESFIRNNSKVTPEHITLICLGGFTNPDGTVNQTVLNQLNDLAGRVHLIPGTTEWDRLGASGLRNLDDFIDGKHDRDHIIPDNACGEVETKSISDNIELVAIDSEWYLRDWNDTSNINKYCAIRDRTEFAASYVDEVFSAKEKMIVLFSYHPPFRYDKKDGHRSLKNHMFPLTIFNRNLFVPLPYFGTLMLQTESYLQSSDYLTHPRYRNLSKLIRRSAKDQKRMIVISANGDQSAITTDRGIHYINISSLENQLSPVVKFEGQYVTCPAVAVIDFTEDQYELNIKDLFTSDTTSLIKVSREMPKIIADEIGSDSFNLSQYSDVTYRPIYPIDKLTQLDADLLTGQLHTELFTQPVKAEVLDLTKSGLKSIKIGGGQQTVSVRLQDDDNNEFVIRSIRKNPAQLLPRWLRIEPVEDLLRYFFTSANPFSFLTITELEKQSGLLHTLPKLMYVPYQEGLAPYNDEIGNQLVLFSDRLDGDRSDSEALMHSPSLISTDDMMDEWRENDITIDAEQYLRNRLLDLTVGDWDRHEDQWRWALHPETNSSLKKYSPVARDRDQAMSNFDGLLVSLNRFYNPRLKPMRPFDEKVSKNDVKWQSISANRIDQFLLTQINRESWNQISAEFSAKFTDDVIKSAVNKMPVGVEQSFKDNTTKILKSRFAQIERTAEHFYKEVNDNLFFFGTESPDSIIIRTESNGDTRVIIKSCSDDGLWRVKTQRLINPKYTKNLHVYGMEGDDIFIIDRKKDHPKLFLIGGYGSDTYRNLNRKKSVARILEVESSTDTDYIEPNFSYFYTKNRDLISFNRYDQVPTYFNATPSLYFDRDNQFFLGLTGHYYVTRFKKNYHHYVGASLSLRRESTHFTYGMEYNNQLRNSSLFFEFNIDGPTYNFSYYGLGNETNLDLDIEREYYFVSRYKQDLTAGIEWKIKELASVSASILTQRFSIDTVDNNRFINENLPSLQVIHAQSFAGLNINFSFKNFNERFRPTNGVSFEADVLVNKGLNNEQDHIAISTQYTLYKSLDFKELFIYSTDISFETIIGSAYFYHQPTIGGNDKLRGWRQDRFRGRTAFVHNNNLHIQLAHRKAVKWLPASCGITASFDYGRVWHNEDQSKVWHSSYGAGIWLSPLNEIVLSASLHIGQETNEFRATLGWQL